MATNTDRMQHRASRQSSGMDVADALAKADALNAELTLLQVQAQALVRTARATRFHF